MTKAHKLLTGTDLHEPKGVATAAAGQVYLSDGAGSGSWVTINTTIQSSTGDIKLTLKQTADADWLMFDDTNIGSAASGATHSGSIYQALFAVLWALPNAYAPVLPSRGGSAAADWAANKTIGLVKVLGRALAISGSGAGLTNRPLGSFLGEENHSLTGNENGPHNHPNTITDPKHQHASTYFTKNFQGGNTGVCIGLDPSVQTGTTTGLSAPSSTFLSIDIGVSGTGAPHNNMQPTAFLNAMVKL